MSDIFFNESVILLDLEAKTSKEVLTLMSKHLNEKRLIKDSYLEAVVSREKEFPTGLPTKGISVAIPHTDAEHVKQKTISLAILKDPVEFGVMGDPHQTTPVKLVFMLAMDEADAQLNLLQNLMKVFQDEEMLQFLVSEKDKSKIVNVLKENLDLTIQGGD